MRIWGRLCVFVMLAMPLSIVVGCGGSSTGGGTTPPPPTTYTIGGTVSGLTGTGLVLQDNGGNNLSVSASGSFTFSTAVNSGATYSVTVSTQPTGQSCSVTSGSGTASANVTNVQVACSNITYTVGGTVSGLTGTGLVLQNDGGNNLAVSASGSFTFSTAVSSGAAYSVTVLTQPAGQSCTVTIGSGTASANVTNVQVACSAVTYTIGGTVSGLDGGIGLVLQDNGGNNLTVSANGAFTFSNSVASGAAYSVTLPTQTTGQICTVTNGSGTASANVTNVQVVCSSLYTIGGTISGLTASGLVLADGTQTVSPASGATAFTFPTAVASGSSYAITVKTQPSGETCSVTNGSGTATANVSNVQVTCTTTTYTIGGTVSGLTGTGLVLQDNSGNNLAVSASGSFTFSTAVASGSTYSVTVLTQPAGQSCSVTNGSGTASANVSNVQVTCAITTYTFGGTVSGLTGTGLVLFNGSTGDKLPVSANGSFTFGVTLPSGASYGVTVLTQPTSQNCTVTNGNGTISANVTNILVTCQNNSYTIGGTISGFTASGLVLAEGSQTVSPASGATSFTFPTAVASGTSYSVTVQTQPSGETCTVTNGSGTVGSSNVTGVAVSCTASTYTIGGTISGLTASGLVLAEGSQTVSPGSGATSFTFPTGVASSTSYSVTVKTQPSGETCTVTNGSGTVGSINVTGVAVSCAANTYTIGGTVSGLTGTGLVLQDNGGNNLAVSANGAFTFTNSVASGAAYNVTVLTQPTGQSCTVTNGSGTASANVTNVQVVCSTVYYTIGGTVSGLVGTGLVLQINGGDNLSVRSKGVFTFSDSFGSGYPYSVTVITQPKGQRCTVSNGR